MISGHGNPIFVSTVNDNQLLLKVIAIIIIIIQELLFKYFWDDNCWQMASLCE